MKPSVKEFIENVPGHQRTRPNLCYLLNKRFRMKTPKANETVTEYYRACWEEKHKPKVEEKEIPRAFVVLPALANKINRIFNPDTFIQSLTLNCNRVADRLLS